MDKDELREIIGGLRRILSEIQSLKDDLRGEFVSREAFDIYFQQLNKDLNNLGEKIRSVEKSTKELERHNVKQDLQVNTITVKIATILGIAGGLGGIGALIIYLLRMASGN